MRFCGNLPLFYFVRMEKNVLPKEENKNYNENKPTL
jgi:hypothetical protein